MRNRVPLGCLAALLLAGAARADDIFSLDAPVLPSDAATPLAAPITTANYLPRFWGEAGYLMAWSRFSPVPTILTTGPTNVLGPSGYPGVVGRNGTQPVLGSQITVFNPQSGFRGVLGGWLDDDSRFGLEMTYFQVLEHSEAQIIGGSGRPGSAPLSVPFFNAAVSAQDSIGLAFARNVDPLAGAARLDLTGRLRSYESNGIARLCQKECSRLDLLVGYRYLTLTEGLYLDTASAGITQSELFRTSDSFLCHNEFNGGQIGLREQVYLGRVFFKGSAKFAIGAMNQETTINGTFVTNDRLITGGQLRQFRGGYLAQPTNIGTTSVTKFAYMPEGSAGVGVHLWDRVRLSATYTFLYISSVARPGDQIDSTINPTQGVAFTRNPNAVLQGPARPVPFNATNDFFLHTLTLGLEVQF